MSNEDPRPIKSLAPLERKAQIEEILELGLMDQFRFWWSISHSAPTTFSLWDPHAYAKLVFWHIGATGGVWEKEKGWEEYWGAWCAGASFRQGRDFQHAKDQKMFLSSKSAEEDKNCPGF